MTTVTPTLRARTKAARRAAPLLLLVLGFLLGAAAYGLGEHFVETYVDHHLELTYERPALGNP